MPRSQRALRFRDGVDYRGQTAASQNEPSRLSPEAQRDAALAKGFVVGPAPQAGSEPAVTGEGYVDLTLEVSDGTWDHDGAETISYQWYRGNTAITGATQDTIALSDADVGLPVFCRVTNQDTLGGGYFDAYYKEGDGLIEDRSGPINVVLPGIDTTGGVAAGDTLEGSDGTWLSDTPAFAYQWFRDGDSISGADEIDYEIDAADEGTSLTLEVTATDARGETVAVSLPVAIPEP